MEVAAEFDECEKALRLKFSDRYKCAGPDVIEQRQAFEEFERNRAELEGNRELTLQQVRREGMTPEQVQQDELEVLRQRIEHLEGHAAAN